MFNIYNNDGNGIFDFIPHYMPGLPLMYDDGLSYMQQLHAVHDFILFVQKETNKNFKELIEVLKFEINRLDGRIDHNRELIEITNDRITKEVIRLDGRIDFNRQLIEATNERITREVERLDLKDEELEALIEKYNDELNARIDDLNSYVDAQDAKLSENIDITNKKVDAQGKKLTKDIKDVNDKLDKETEDRKNHVELVKYDLEEQIATNADLANNNMLAAVKEEKDARIEADSRLDIKIDDTAKTAEDIADNKVRELKNEVLIGLNNVKEYVDKLVKDIPTGGSILFPRNTVVIVKGRFGKDDVYYPIMRSASSLIALTERTSKEINVEMLFYDNLHIHTSDKYIHIIHNANFSEVPLKSGPKELPTFAKKDPTKYDLRFAGGVNMPAIILGYFEYEMLNGELEVIGKQKTGKLVEGTEYIRATYKNINLEKNIDAWDLADILSGEVVVDGLSKDAAMTIALSEIL